MERAALRRRMRNGSKQIGQLQKNFGIRIRNPEMLNRDEKKSSLSIYMYLKKDISAKNAPNSMDYSGSLWGY